VEQIGFLVGSVTDELINVEGSAEREGQREGERERERDEPDSSVYLSYIDYLLPLHWPE